MSFNFPLSLTFKQLCLSLSLLFGSLAAFSQDAFVNPSGSCSGTPCFTTISAAVAAAIPGYIIEVEDGVYNENVTIDKSLTLQSANGYTSTTIQGSDVSLGTVFLPSGSSNITVDGFTIIGYDGASAGLEKAAVYLQGAQTGITIQNNEIVANGEAGLLSEFNAAIDDILIDNNIFSGKTFVGTTPAGCGFGTQFTELNVPRQLVVMGGGSGVTNSQNVTFSNNQITGTAGAPKPGCNSPFDYQGNTLVTLDVINAVITGNLFAGSTGRFASALRARGTNTTISGNTFDGSNLAAVAAYLFIDADALDGASPGTLAEVINANTFVPAGTISGSGIYPCNPSAPPAPWQSASIGNAGAGNDSSFDGCEGAFTVSSGGNNATSSTTDNVSFVYQTICGNGSITAKIENLSPNGYAGLMVRQNSSAGAMQASIFSNLTPSLRVEARSSMNAPKQVNSFFKPSFTWLKLERQGNWVFMYSSNNGMNFAYVHAVFVPFQGCVDIGLASFSYQPGQQANAVFTDVSITGGTAPAMEALEVRPAQQSKVSLYPNPAANLIKLELEEQPHENLTAELRNQLGQVVGQKNINGRFYLEWDVSHLAEGVYFIVLHQPGQQAEVLKFVKSK